MDRTVVQRVKRQRERRSRAGWVEVKVWVPNKAAAERIKQFAAEERSIAPAVPPLTKP